MYDFDDEDEAFQYWQEEIYYGSGEGYVGRGRCFDAQVDMFREWAEENNVSWPNMKDK